VDRLLIIGCGDVARRALPALQARYDVHALVRDPDDAAALRERGVTTIVGDLDHPASLAPLAGLAPHVAHLAPPPDHGTTDARTRALISALERRGIVSQGVAPSAVQPDAGVARLVYVSTTGVYGDCAGAWVDESRPPHPQTQRAIRRLDAETQLLAWGRATGASVAVLRAPGIYATDRLPLERLRRGTPVLDAADDVYTNHIHADDLAAIVVAALDRARPGEVYNATDDSELRMSEWFDLVADRHGLPRPPRVSRADAPGRIPPAMLSFMSESRRLSNAKLKAHLGVTLRYPTVADGVPWQADLRRP